MARDAPIICRRRRGREGGGRGRSARWRWRRNWLASTTTTTRPSLPGVVESPATPATAADRSAVTSSPAAIRRFDDAPSASGSSCGVAASRAVSADVDRDTAGRAMRGKRATEPGNCVSGTAPIIRPTRSRSAALAAEGRLQPAHRLGHSLARLPSARSGVGRPLELFDCLLSSPWSRSYSCLLASAIVLLCIPLALRLCFSIRMSAFSTSCYAMAPSQPPPASATGDEGQ